MGKCVPGTPVKQFTSKRVTLHPTKPMEKVLHQKGECGEGGKTKLKGAATITVIAPSFYNNQFGILILLHYNQAQSSCLPRYDHTPLLSRQ